jgi:hypothetical protein
VLVVATGAVGRDLVERAARRYAVSVTGRLDCFELPTEDGPHLGQYVIVAEEFEVVSNQPF